MKTKPASWILIVSLTVAFALSFHVNAQPQQQSTTQDSPKNQDKPKSEPKTKGQIISASFDKTGQHPGTAAIGGAVAIACVSADSSSPNPQPRPSCLIQAPGYSGNLNPGQSAGASGAGTVILNCNGQGDRLTCSARIG
jgi:hypothetical protein